MPGREVPSYEVVEAMLVDLIDGTRSRDEIAEWAFDIVASDPYSDPSEVDDAVWDALNALAGADSPQTYDEESQMPPASPEHDPRYVFQAVDFRDWLEELRSAPRGRDAAGNEPA